MEPQFWLDRWKQGDIGFNRQEPSSALRRFWSRLDLGPQESVFVPLCGMSVDMAWLAQAGHKVVGVELSEIAVRAFFEDQKLEPARQVVGDFEVWTAGRYELWVGDLFKLPSQAISKCAAVYDRASLVAFPMTMQSDFVELLRSHLPVGAQILLVSLAYDQAEMNGPPFSTPLSRIETLFGNSFDIKVLDEVAALEQNESLKKRGLSALTEGCYFLQGKGAA